jgi:hypothetical protein
MSSARPRGRRGPFQADVYCYGEKTARQYVAFSKDGIEWQQQPELSHQPGDCTNVPPRDHRGKYAAYCATPT